MNRYIPYNKHIRPKASYAVVKRGNTDGMIEAVVEESVKKFGPCSQSPHNAAKEGKGNVRRWMRWGRLDNLLDTRKS